MFYTDLGKIRLSFPDHSPYLGFDHDHEFYYREGCINCYSIGSFLIALTDISLSGFYYNSKEICSNAHLAAQEHISPYSSDSIKKFAKHFVYSYNTLSNLHLALGDLLISPLVFPFDREQRNGIIVHSEFGDTAFFNCSDLAGHVFDCCSYHGLDDFSCDKFLSFFNCKREYTDQVYRQIDSLISWYEIFFEYLAELNSLFLPLTGILKRSNISPASRYTSFLETGCPPNCESNSYLTPSQEYRLSKVISSLSPLTRLVRYEQAPPYDRSSGYRLVNFYKVADIARTVYAEFEFMCMNNIELAICKNCGRLFVPQNRASNFCNRPLFDNSSRTCKSLSSHWYAKDRKGEDPAYDYYTKLKKRYHTRTLRNLDANPYDRYNDWVQQAKLLLDKYRRDKLSYDEFTMALEEMDKDMKPLDKM